MPWYDPLTNAYPAPVPSWRNAGYALLLGAFVFGFLYYFQPFGLQGATYADDPLRMGGFGLIAAGVCLVFLVGLPAVWPAAVARRWRGGHQLVYLLLLLLGIATLNGSYLNRLEGEAFSWGNYSWIIVRTAALGAAPLAVLFLLDANRNLRTNLAAAAAINPRLPVAPAAETRFELPGGPSLPVTAFLYARAYGNYVRFYYENGGRVEDRLLRLTLAAAQRTYAGLGYLRCHRSYLVNPRRVVRAEGNAQNLQLVLGADVPTVPVSRSYVAAVRVRLAGG